MPGSSALLLVVHASVATTSPRRAILADLDGRPALRLLLDRLAAPSTLAPRAATVLTSDLRVDDEVCELAQAAGWSVVRGPADDLLGGLAIAMVRHQAGSLALVEATGPLGDPHLIAATAQLHERSGVDVASNLAPRSHPRGLDVEVIGARALRRCELETTDPADRRAPGAAMRRHPERFALANLTSGHALAAEDWTVTTDAGLDHVRDLVGQLADPVSASWNRILSVGGRIRRPRPGDVVLTPRQPAGVGSSPWVQRWDATIDGREVGCVTAATDSGRTEVEVHVAEDHREAVRAELYRLRAMEEGYPV